jgi:hypothetical protein
LRWRVSYRRTEPDFVPLMREVVESGAKVRARWWTGGRRFRESCASCWISLSPFERVSNCSPGAELTFFACHISPSCNSVFFRFPLFPSAVADPLDDPNVRSTSHSETSTSFPAAANAVALFEEEAIHVSGPGMEVLRTSSPVFGIRYRAPDDSAASVPLSCQLGPRMKRITNTDASTEASPAQTFPALPVA